MEGLNMDNLAMLIVQGVAVIICFIALINTKSKILFCFLAIAVLLNMVLFYKTYFVYFVGF
jgi:hypothetical protein